MTVKEVIQKLLEYDGKTQVCFGINSDITYRYRFDEQSRRANNVFQETPIFVSGTHNNDDNTFFFDRPSNKQDSSVCLLFDVVLEEEIEEGTYD